MAAYDGNIERFSRLASGGKKLSDLDLECVLRGILHHSMFARWWADQIKEYTVYAEAAPYITWIQEAIVAQRIMVNDYTEFEKGWPLGVPKPYIIWWPLQPDAAFLIFLLERCPEFSMQIAAAAIVCDYGHVYHSVNPEPSWDLWKVTMFSPNPFYREDQERRAKEKDVDFTMDSWDVLEPLHRYRDLMQTREITILEPYEGRIRDTVEEYEVRNGYEKILSTGDVQVKIWEGVGKNYYNLPLKDFYSWNPSVGTSCLALLVNYWVYISVVGWKPPVSSPTPSPTQPANGIKTPSTIQSKMTKNCNKVHTVISTTTCTSIQNYYKISMSQLAQ
ncbi:hypothetical protein ACHAPM_001507 [Fusarium culmorum]